MEAYLEMEVMIDSARIGGSIIEDDNNRAFGSGRLALQID